MHKAFLPANRCIIPSMLSILSRTITTVFRSGNSSTVTSTDLKNKDRHSEKGITNMPGVHTTQGISLADSISTAMWADTWSMGSDGNSVSTTHIESPRRSEMPHNVRTLRSTTSNKSGTVARALVLDSSLVCGFEIF